MYKLFLAKQIQAWDAATIAHEPIPSIDLMERAASACARWLLSRLSGRRFTILCGTGNNGGDGLAIARMLCEAKQEVTCFIAAADASHGSPDFLSNLERLKALPVTCIFSSSWPNEHRADVLIDALFGSGLDRALTGSFADLVRSASGNANSIVSIDLPSGHPADEADFTHTPFDAIDADHVLTFMAPKRSFFFPNAAKQQKRLREVHVIDIQLDPRYLKETPCDLYAYHRDDARGALQPRQRFTHKGSHGAALIMAGQAGMLGAPALATGAALRSGTGLVYSHVPSSGTSILQGQFPEAILITDPEADCLSELRLPEKVTACGIGPGIGTRAATAELLCALLDRFDGPVVLDADALNLVAKMPKLRAHIARHKRCILTPHPTEFDRLFGEHHHLQDRLKTAQQQAKELHAVIHLKGAFSMSVSPEGKKAFNTSGSSALAVGGSGDVLTGLLTGLLAQGYPNFEACTLAAWMHGRAGELYATTHSKHGMRASDLIELLPDVYSELERLE